MNSKQAAYQQCKFDNRNNVLFAIVTIFILVLIISGATSCKNKTATVCIKSCKSNPYKNNQHQEKPCLGYKIVNDKGEEITGANSYIVGINSVASGDVVYTNQFNIK